MCTHIFGWLGSDEWDSHAVCVPKSERKIDKIKKKLGEKKVSNRKFCFRPAAMSVLPMFAFLYQFIVFRVDFACWVTDEKKKRTLHGMHAIKIQRNHLKLINFLFEMELLTQFTLIPLTISHLFE